MIVLIGKNEKILNEPAFKGLVCGFKYVCLDIGTGDGRNIYKRAKLDQETLYIGVDPARDNMLKTSSKLIKKRNKGGLNNVLLILSSLECLPTFLDAIADKITVYFPWGILLEGIVKPKIGLIQKIANLGKSGATFEFLTTYAIFDGKEITSRNLPVLSLDYFNGEYKNELECKGLFIQGVETFSNYELKNIDSCWAKRLAFGKERCFFRLAGMIKTPC